MSAYYNENDPYAAQWLRNLIGAGLIPAGDVDERSIVDVQPSDVAGYVQCHFFAGLGGWAYAARLAGWPDSRPLWTGSCPCQPFSVAGRGEGKADARHLWPEFHRLIAACKPSVVMGEQVAAAVGKNWLDGVFTDLERSGYACGAAVVPACAVDAPHRRDRLWFVADNAVRQRGLRTTEVSSAKSAREIGGCCSGIALAHTDQHGRNKTSERAVVRECNAEPCRDMGHAHGTGSPLSVRQPSHSQQKLPAIIGAGWGGAERIAGADGKARRVKSGICLLAHGIPARVGKLRALGNAIVPQVAAEVISAYIGQGCE